MNKIKYYSDRTIVRDYNKRRYGGESGRHINKKELSIVKKLLPQRGKLLDFGCGLGRLDSILTKQHHVVGVDSSQAMLANCVYKHKILSKASKLPFKKEEFDIAVILRFLFHYQNIEKYLKEAKRVTKKDGIIIFETYRWSPKMFFDIKMCGGKVYIHSDKKIKKMLRELNLKLLDRSSIALFSPYIQKQMPLFLIKWFTYLEKTIPKSFLVDVYWKVQKI